MVLRFDGYSEIGAHVWSVLLVDLCKAFVQIDMSNKSQKRPAQHDLRYHLQYY